MPRVSTRQQTISTIQKLIELDMIIDSSDDNESLDSKSSSENSSESEEFSGLPGSVQDVFAARRSTLWKYLERDESVIFGREEYLLGDSGYIPMPHLVPAFKVSAANREKSDFNNCLAHARVINEHCIGVLKSRWHSLKQLRTQLKCRRENRIIVKWIKCCVLLHNFMLSMKDDWTSADGAVEHDPTPNENPIATGLGAGQSGTSLRNRSQLSRQHALLQHSGALEESFLQ
ncbi:hypothetical protein R1sor_022171 [Riccia sorocarpa]|uniref:DDE Tnp4 domain-containing protein n=1 Tax=Riccia sorocarpa TaxID=122646 RepID=A0ABD3GJ28_9MARC